MLINRFWKLYVGDTPTKRTVSCQNQNWERYRPKLRRAELIERISRTRKRTLLP